jgi:hypothetical protein
MAAVLAAGAVLVGAGWAIWSALDRPQLLPGQTRPYSALSACLLTDARGVASRDAAAVWSGMQAAASDTNANITNTQVPSAATAPQVDVAVNSLVAEHCSVVVAVGQEQVAAVALRATAFPAERFVAVGGRTTPAKNVRQLADRSDALSDEVHQALIDALSNG